MKYVVKIEFGDGSTAYYTPDVTRWDTPNGTSDIAHAFRFYSHEDAEAAMNRMFKTEMTATGFSVEAVSNKGITVSDLITELKRLDGDRLVVLQRDSEGNACSPISGLWEGAYKADTADSGDAYLEALDDALRKQGFTEEDVCEDGEKAVFLVPTR